MSDYAYFYNSENGDRVYDADSFSNWLKKFFTTGVFEGDCQVTALGNMVVNLAPGYANIMGKVKELENQTFTLEPADGSYPRIDTIVIERNDTDRDITAKLVTGELSGNDPVPTARVWENGVYQLVVAEIYVAAGATEVTQANITDKRSDPDVCGIVAGTVTEMDFSQFTAQFEAYFAEFEASNLEEFDEWFQHMKDQLDTDAAGHLQNEIDALSRSIDTQLAGYTFHPSGSIDLVAYIADDSYYLNEDNKYVLADSPTGQALITSEPSTYKVLASNTDLYGIEGEDTVSGFEPSSTPITVGGQTLSTIDDKLNFLVGNIIPVLDREICNAFLIFSSGGSRTNGACVRKTDGTVLNGGRSTVTTEDFIIENFATIKANKTGKYLIFGPLLDDSYSPTISAVDVNANDTLINLQAGQGHVPNSVVVIIRLD